MSGFLVLPEALMMDIWLGLSIKSSVRFRCVSKSWCAFLSDPHFIYKNLTLSDDVAANELLLLVNLEGPHYSVVSRATLTATSLQVPPEVPIPDPSRNTDILTTPCDDMVCFYDDLEPCIRVWNLTTSEIKMVPRPSTENGCRRALTLGFGFDEKTKEYKIVQIYYDCRAFIDCKARYTVAYVYSLSSSNNCWRKVGEPKMPYQDGHFPGSVYFRSYGDGKFYWANSGQILSFDMSTEVFNMISIPFLDGRLSDIDGICKLKEGSMLMIVFRMIGTFYDEALQYEIWALLELGVTQSWIKLFVIDWGGKEDVPLGFWRNEVVLKCERNSRLTICDPFKREIKEIQLDEPADISRCLVWAKGKKATTALLSGLQGEGLE